jgi:hypothetical protein
MRVAVYSCNFGNYNLRLSKQINYYFFTDNKNLKSKKWKVIQTPLIPGDSIMDTNRWTSKYIKFCTPEILSTYDVLIWCDSKCLSYFLNNINIKSIENYIKQGYSLINVKHYGRKTIQEEIQITIQRELENTENGKKFLEEVGETQYRIPLTDTRCIIRKNTTDTNVLFKKVYSLLQEKGLKRDQNVYLHAIDILEYPVEQIQVIPQQTIKEILTKKS